MFEEEPEIKFFQDEHVALRKPTLEVEKIPFDAVATSLAKIRSYTSKMESKRKFDPKRFKDV